ncbi:SDR family NAD(P)-dependent oxidoreductase [Roseospirillum parvum]|uniref:NAD(P)-dependent dehydrogenase, short-chain alcohol dehydrogenase family n=1 Tax=Roseospirillum parvum TaxID=83401 RepID=A0A1G8BKU9_9PROT|nr:SDR family oxidoreductase [Roseospirillum parvum]SDH33852.1 NAD(P)-dependent dehydrogenase, short-chain alcohol dehydrogenase family [Roseospirillum parvum]
MSNASTPKTVVISGASRGIGQATARRFMNEGWRVITCARGPLPDDPTRTELWQDHFTVDLADGNAVEAFVRDVKKLLGGAPLNALVNNAGVSPKTEFKERLGVLNGPIAGWRDVFALNFFAPLILARGFASDLHKAKGSVVNITSIAGHYVHPFAGSAYSTSKAALSGLTREMAAELAQLGIRANAVAPGEIATEMVGPEYEALIPRIPLDRMGTPEDVATTVFRLCSDEFGYVTGTEIFVTGGQHLY